MSEKFCSVCGVSGDVDFIYEMPDGTWMCHECAIENGFAYCEECGEYRDEDDFVFINTRSYGRGTHGFYVCTECAENNSSYYRCEECGDWFNEEYMSRFRTVDNADICIDCFEDNYRECYHCGAVDREYNMVYDEDEEVWYCAECSESIAIKGYSYKPCPKCKGDHGYRFDYPEESDELLLGVELEIDDGEEPYATAGKLMRLSEDIYIKHDGSLSEEGMEIVTHPCTIGYHMDGLGWDRLCEKALECGYSSHTTRRCGMHVHVGRTQLGKYETERKETICKMIMLVDRHWAALAKFSRRLERQLNQWAARPNLELDKLIAPTERVAIDKAWATSANGRYQAINLRNNSTIEFRLFNGTLKLNTIIATLQFVHNICEYAKAKTVEEVLASKWDELRTFHEWDELNTYMAERELMNVDDPEPIKLVVVGEQTEMDMNENHEPSYCNFQVGDRVRIVNANGFDILALREGIGETGTIVTIQTNGHIGVRFDRRFSSYLHGRVTGSTDEREYWVGPENIERFFDFERIL